MVKKLEDEGRETSRYDFFQIIKAMKSIPIATVLFFCVCSMQCQTKNPYEKWDIKSIGELSISDFNSFAEIEDSIKMGLGYEEICNERLLAKIKVENNEHFNAVLYKYCPYDFPILTPRLKIIVDSYFDKLENLDVLLLATLDSLSNKAGTNENNYAVIWNRKYCSNEIKLFFEAAYLVYKNRYVNYGGEDTYYYDFPLMFFALKDASHWNLKDTIRPPLKVKFENDSIIILE